VSIIHLPSWTTDSNSSTHQKRHSHQEEKIYRYPKFLLLIGPKHTQWWFKVQGIGEAPHARVSHIGGFVSSDHIIPTPHLSLSAHSPPSPLPQQLCNRSNNFLPIPTQLWVLQQHHQL
jgi:hypothetical protein